MFDLAAYLPYLLNRAGVSLAESFTAELEPYGIGLGMWRVMAALRYKSEQRVGQLAAMTAIEVSTLSRLVGAMERKGLALRQRSAADARTVQVRLTAAGIRIANALIPKALHYQEVALAGFSAAEAAALKSMLVRVFDNIGVLGEERRAPGRRIA